MPEFVQAIVTLSAVVLGFGLSHYSEKKRRDKEQKLGRANLRRLLQIETEENVLALGTYWKNMLEAHESWLNEEGDFPYAQLANEVAKKPFPVLSTDVWYSNLSDVPSFLELSTIERLWVFYKRVERLSSLYSFFSEKYKDSEAEAQHHNLLHGGGVGHLISGWGFANSVKENSAEFKTILETVLEFHINA